MEQTLTAETLTLDDPEIARLASELARDRSVSVSEAVRLALAEAAERERVVQKRLAAMREVRAKVMQRPSTGLEADKAFYDSLNDEED